ncbi:MAG: hypothetical protein ACOYNY_12650, partial [Caldilineaceae bacterium]
MYPILAQLTSSYQNPAQKKRSTFGVENKRHERSATGEAYQSTLPHSYFIADKRQFNSYRTLYHHHHDHRPLVAVKHFVVNDFGNLIASEVRQIFIVNGLFLFTKRIVSNQ